MIHDTRSRALEAAAFALKLAALFACLAILAGTARAGGTPLGAIPLTTPIYSASEVDALAAARGVAYATCVTAQGTAAKVAATAAGDFSLTNGAKVAVRFSAANTVATPTLNVDGTGARTIRKYGTTSALGYYWRAGAVVEFVYDGTQFEMSGGSLADTTYYGWTKLSNATNSTSTVLAATANSVYLVRQEVGRVAGSIPSVEPVWDTAAIGANPSVALAVAPCTSYRRTGSGTLTLTAVTGLSSAPTYCVLSGFSSLVLPSGFAVAGSGAFRAGHENHLALWTDGATQFVNFLFAQ